MADSVRLLEDRVGRAIARLASLSHDRAELAREVDELRARVAELEREAQAAVSDERHERETWRRDRSQVVSVLRESLVELRRE